MFLNAVVLITVMVVGHIYHLLSDGPKSNKPITESLVPSTSVGLIFTTNKYDAELDTFSHYQEKQLKRAMTSKLHINN